MDITKKIDVLLTNEIIDLTGAKKDRERRVAKIIRYVLEHPDRIPADNWKDAFIYMAKKERFNKKEMKALLKKIEKRNIEYPFDKAQREKGVPRISKLTLPVNLTTFYLGK